jgi:hypothetical protein
MGNRLYVFGGFAQEGGPVADAFSYDPANDRWARIASLPSPRGAAGAAVLGRHIHVVGGNASGSVPLHQRYDAAADSWMTLAPLPVGRDHLAVVAAGGTLYAIAGRINSFSRNVDRVDAYDAAADRWSSRKPMPTARSGVAAALYRDRIVVCGGESPRHAFDTVEAYDVGRDAWSALEPLPEPRHGTGAAAIGGVLFVPAGGPRPGGSQSDTLFAYAET